MKKIIDFINKQNPLLWSVLIYMFLILISYLIRDYRPLACDMAEYINNPVRVLNGDLPYRDFWLLFPPGEVYLPAFIYSIFGINIDILRFISIMISCLIPVAGFYLGKHLFGDNFKSFVAAFIMFFVSVVSNYEGPDYIHVYLLLIILSLIQIVKYFKYPESDKPRYNLLLFSGLLIGAATMFKLYEVGGVLIAFLLIILYGQNYLKMNSLMKPVLYFTAGCLIVPFLNAILLINILPVMFNELVVESLKNGTSMNQPYFNDMYYVVQSIKEDLQIIGNNPKEAVSLIYHSMKFITSLLFYLLPFISLTYLLIIRKLKGVERIIALLLFAWAIASFPKALGRSDLAHLAPSVAPFLLFMMFAGFNSQTNKLVRKVTALLAALMLMTSLYPAFKLATLIKSPLIYVETERGSVPFKSSKDAEEFRKTLDYIEHNTEKDDYIFVTLWDAPPVYALTGRRNPTYYDSLNDLIIRRNESKQKRIIDDIIAKKTRFIIHNPDWGYDNKPEQQFRYACNVLQSFIDSKCTKVEDFGFYKIYKIN